MKDIEFIIEGMEMCIRDRSMRLYIFYGDDGLPKDRSDRCHRVDG